MEWELARAAWEERRCDRYIKQGEKRGRRRRMRAEDTVSESACLCVCARKLPLVPLCPGSAGPR